MYFLALALSGLVAATAFGLLIPWCARLLSLYWAHFIRDRIYRVGSNEVFRNTLIYNDAEWIACLTIRALRSPDSDLFGILARAALSSSKNRPANEWRRRRYDKEMQEI